MTYQEALAFIHGAYAQGRKHGLDNMRALLARLGDPQRMFRAVHVAGTNGKGSVCAFLQAALRCEGYRTGLYTSPYLQRYNERMRIDGTPIDDRTLARLTSRVAEVVEALRAEGIFPTEFEVGTAIAFVYFAEANADIAVIEVGLGGRLDPTNVIKPLVSVIAQIGLDHTGILGETIELIAAEKAGIVKTGVPLVLSVENAVSVQHVVQAKCREVEAPFILAEPAADWDVGLKGAYQAANAGTAIEALRQLRKQGIPLRDDSIAAGIRRARWPGRLEWVEGKPPLLLDGAHNVHGAQALADAVAALPASRRVLLCGIMRDKDWRHMASVFATFSDAVVVVTPENPRAVAPTMLAEAFEDTGVTTQIGGSATEALRQAILCAGPDGLVVVAGSLYVVGEVRRLLPGLDDSLLAQE